MPAAWKRQAHTHMPTNRVQANFSKAKLHNADWSRALLGEYPWLKHDSEVHAVAVLGGMIVTGCKDGKVCIWKDDKVSKMQL